MDCRRRKIMLKVAMACTEIMICLPVALSYPDVCVAAVVGLVNEFVISSEKVIFHTNPVQIADNS